MARKSRKNTVYTEEKKTSKQVLTSYNAALYARISVETEEKINRDSMGVQIAMLQEFAATIDDLSVVDLYVDDDVTGTSFERPAYSRMMEDVEKGKINCIIVKDLSRFARDHIDAGEYLEKIFPEKEVRFIAITDKFDTLEDDGGIIIPIKNLFNERYARDVSSKLISNFKTMQKNGEFCSSRAPYGYLRSEVDKHHFVIDPVAAENVRKIFEWCAEGATIHKIAKRLMEQKVPCPSKYLEQIGIVYDISGKKDFWYPHTIRTILKSQTYCGDMVQNRVQSTFLDTGKKGTFNANSKDDWIIVPDQHEAIISRELYETVQEIVAHRAAVSEQRKKSLEKVENPEYCLSGILRCRYCGTPINVKRSRRNNQIHYRYICPKNDSFGEKGCEKKLMDFDKTNDLALMILKKYIDTFLDTKRALEELNSTESADECRNRIESSISKNRREIRKKTMLKKNLYQDFTEGLIDQTDYTFMSEQYSIEIKDCEKKIRKRKEELELYKNQYEVPEDVQSKIDRIRKARKLSKEYVEWFIESIEVDNEGTFDVKLKVKDEYEEMLSLYTLRKEGLEYVS